MGYEYTLTDLENLQAAKLAILNGSRAESVTIGNKTIKYTSAKISELDAAISAAKSSLGVVTRRVYAKQGGRAS